MGTSHSSQESHQQQPQQPHPVAQGIEPNEDLSTMVVNGQIPLCLQHFETRADALEAKMREMQAKLSSPPQSGAPPQPSTSSSHPKKAAERDQDLDLQRKHLQVFTCCIPYLATPAAPHHTKKAAPPATPTPCKYYARGSCKWGSKCWYLHDGNAKPPAAPRGSFPHPSHWLTRRFKQLYYRVDVPEAVAKQITQAFLTSSHTRCFPERLKLPQKPEVTRVYQIENPELWYTYQRKRAQLKKQHAHFKTPVVPYPTPPDLLPGPILDSSLNEIYAFHGTKGENIEKILAVGLDARHSKMSGQYGAGIYFSDQACKSMQYTDFVGSTNSGNESSGKQGGVLFLCRVTLGVCHVAAPEHAYAHTRLAPAIPGSSDFHDSVVAESVTASQGRQQVHREFVVYDNAQAYPEYLIEFEV